MSEEEITRSAYIRVDQNVTRIVSCVDHIEIWCENERILFYFSDRKLVRMQGTEVKETLYLENKSVHDRIMHQDFIPPHEDAKKYIPIEGVVRIGLHEDCIELDRGIKIDYIRKSDNMIFRKYDTYRPKESEK